MQLKNTLISFALSTLLIACNMNGGTMRSNNLDSSQYGFLQESSVTPGPVFFVESLQQWLIGDEGVCNGINLNTSVGLGMCFNNINYINNTESIFGNISVQKLVEKNTLGIESISTFSLAYNTPGAPYSLAGNATQTQIVSGSVIIPNGIESSQIKGIVLYFHPTVLSKQEVPSNFNNLAGLYFDKEMAAIFASQGYIVVLPDYVGQGIDVGVMHPYVAYPQTNALSGIYMLKATRQMLLDQGISQNLSLFITSYSEGGAYALWASKLLQTVSSSVLSQNNFTLVRTVGISGAYDLTGAMLPFGFANVNNSWESNINIYNVSPGGMFAESPESAALIYRTQSAFAALNMAASKPPLASYLLASLIYYNGTSSNLLDYFMLPSFVSMNSCLYLGNYFAGESQPTNCLINNQNYQLLQLFTTNASDLTSSNIANQLIGSAIGSSNYITGGMSSESLIFAMILSGYRNNSVTKFVSDTILKSTLVIPYLQQQNIYNWTTNSPLSLLYLSYDSTVTNIDSLKACGAVAGVPSVKANSALGMVTCQPVDNTNLYTTVSIPGSQKPLPIFIDHGQAEPILQLAALHQIESQ